MISAVFDTVIFVRSLINPDSRWGRLVFEKADSYRLAASHETIGEVLVVLSRPELVRKFRGFGDLNRQAVFDRLAAAEIVEVRAIPAVARDPKDDVFLATAAAAHADYLVSEDNDLLVLGEYDGVRIVDAATFLAIIEAPDAPG